MSNEKMTLYLKIWRQKSPNTPGEMVPYTVHNITPHMSFLEMLDVLNEQLIKEGKEPVEFDNDCREGICGMCSLVINGIPHGPESETPTTCLSEKKKPTKRWMPPNVSAAVHVLPPALTLLLHYLSVQKSHNSPTCRKVIPNVIAAWPIWLHKWTRKVSAAALTTASAKLYARKAFRLKPSL